MTEVALNTGPEKKRRLPVWMLRVKSDDELRSSGNRDSACAATEYQHDQQASGSKQRSISGKRGRSSSTGDTDGSDDLENLHKKEAKQSATEVSKRHSDIDTLVMKHADSKIKQKKETGGDKLMKQKRVASKKQNQTVKRVKNNETVSSPGSNEDELELTVEDLLCIAEEYVEADRKKQWECSTVRESESAKRSSTHTSTSSASFRTNTLGAFHSAGSSKALMKCTSTEMDRKNPKVETLARNVTRTGDAAQDMLNLLLGPLLNNPVDKEKEFRDALTESMLSARDTNDQVGTETCNKEVSFTKKKSSLKDKVAMLLG